MDNGETRSSLERPLDPSYTNGIGIGGIYGVPGYGRNPPYGAGPTTYMNKAVDVQAGRIEQSVNNYAVMEYGRHYLPRNEHSDYNSFRNYIMSRIEQPDFTDGAKRVESCSDKQLGSSTYNSAYGFPSMKEASFHSVPSLGEQLQGFGMNSHKQSDFASNGHSSNHSNYMSDFSGMYSIPNEQLRVSSEHSCISSNSGLTSPSSKVGRYSTAGGSLVMAPHVEMPKSLPPLLSGQQHIPSSTSPQSLRSSTFLSCFTGNSEMQTIRSGSDSASSISPSISLPQPSPVRSHTPKMASPVGSAASVPESNQHTEQSLADHLPLIPTTVPSNPMEMDVSVEQTHSTSTPPPQIEEKEIDEEEAMDIRDADTVGDSISDVSPSAKPVDECAEPETNDSTKDTAELKPDTEPNEPNEPNDETKQRKEVIKTAVGEEHLDPEKQFALAFEQAKAASMRAQAELTKKNLEQAAMNFDVQEEFMPSMVEDTPGMVYQCKLCSYSGTSRFHFNSHMNTHFDHKCSVCDYTSRTEARLKKHIREFHSDMTPDNIQSTRVARTSQAAPKQKIYRCKQCEFSAINKNEFWDHSRIHIKIDKMLSCPKCNFVTEYKHHLEYHLRNHFGSKPFKCSKCNYSCVNKSMLNSHMKSHSNFYQYRCQDCTYATKYCHSLKLHLRKYNHKPATVLSGGDMFVLQHPELLLGRRGPRGPKKKMFGIPELPSLINGGLRHSPFGFPIPAGFNGLPPAMMGNLLMHHKPPVSQSQEVALVGDHCLSCNLCDFRTKFPNQLNRHMLLHAAAENQDLCKLYGISSETLMAEGRQVAQSVLREGQLSPGEVRHWAQEIEKMSPLKTSTSSKQNAGSLYKNVEGVDKARVLDLSRNRDVDTSAKDSVDQADTFKVKQEPDSGKETFAENCSKSEASLPIQTDSQLAPNVALSPPRNRRKGKAYKLDRICMKLQKQFSPSQESNDSFSSDSGQGAYGLDSEAMEEENKVGPEPGERTHEVVSYGEGEHSSPNSKAQTLINKNGVSTSFEHDERYHCTFPDLQSLYDGQKLFGRPDIITKSTGSSLITMKQMSNSADPADAGEAYECSYCEISFKNCVMYTMHMGYHGYRDPFKCNMCGHQAEDKVSFFLHIARASHM